MTPLAQLISDVRGWIAIDPEVYPDSVVTSWVKFAIEYLSEELRVRQMIQLDWTNTVDGRLILPRDWLELDTVRFYPVGKPMVYAPRNEFYVPQYDINNRYTIVGNYILIGKKIGPEGVDMEISYYQRIPMLTDDPDNVSWIWTDNSRLLTLCVLWHAAAYAIEDERVGGWQQSVVDMVNTMNMAHQTGKSSGSILVARRRSFG
jgi:hypothetical protein